MLSKDAVLVWNEVLHDLYEEDGYIFGVEFDLCNNHEIYYCKTTEGDTEYYYDLSNDIYAAIEQFNEILEDKLL